MTRYATFRFCLDPTAGQQAALARHAGAARFAYNECLRAVKRGLTERKADPSVRVPWSGLDLINYFNGWKKTAAAGRVIAVSPDGEAEVIVTGLRWRSQVCQQVFEEAAVDLGRALAAWSQSRLGQRKGRRAGFPRRKRKTRCAWRGGQVITAGRWYPSSKRCSACGTVKDRMPLSARVFRCAACGTSIDRDLNAAVNLAAWAEDHAQARDPQAGGPVTNARRQDGPDRRPRAGETILDDAGTHGTAI